MANKDQSDRTLIRDAIAENPTASDAQIAAAVNEGREHDARVSPDQVSDVRASLTVKEA